MPENLKWILIVSTCVFNSVFAEDRAKTHVGVTSPLTRYQASSSEIMSPNRDTARKSTGILRKRADEKFRRAEDPACFETSTCGDRSLNYRAEVNKFYYLETLVEQEARKGNVVGDEGPVPAERASSVTLLKS